MQPEAIYEALAHQEGVHLPGHGERGSTSGLNAADIMVKSGPMLPSLVGPERLKMELEKEQCKWWPVGDDGHLYGMAAHSHGVTEIKTSFPYEYPDHSLSQLLERMREFKVDTLPIVSRADIHRLFGVVTLRRVLSVYELQEEHASAEIE